MPVSLSAVRETKPRQKNNSMKKIGIEIKGVIAISITALLLIIICAGWFYWYEWRPSQIRNKCNKEALETSLAIKGATFDIYDFSYKACLRQMGLEK
jgi:hypothetical protein